jgi:hypothetical protein
MKDACRPCVEIEEMLSLNQAIGSIKTELMHLQTLRLEARKLKRESEAVDLVVQRHTEQLRQLKMAFNRKYRHIYDVKGLTQRKRERESERE